MSQNVQHFHPFLLTFWFDAVAENDLVPGLMRTVFKSEAATLPGLLQRPAGEDTRNLGDVLLGIAAIYAKGMQLHQLAPIVFIEPVALAFGLGGLPPVPDPLSPFFVSPLGNAVGNVGIWSHAQPVVRS